MKKTIPFKIFHAGTFLLLTLVLWAGCTALIVAALRLIINP